jgi:glycosyltransferase involved in cell wall biosynthesis
MKVLHVFKSYYPDTVGGIEQVVYQLAEGARECGIEADVFCLSNNESVNNKVNNHYVFRVKQDFYIASTGFSLSAFWKFRSIAKEYDVIHYHFPWPFMDLLDLFVSSKKKKVVTYHSDIIKQKFLLKLYFPLMYFFLKRMNVIVASSENYVASSSVLKLFKNKTKVIPFGLNASHYVVEEERKSYWKKEINGRFFLFVGALRYYKGLHFLLEALSQLDYPCVIVGGGFQEEQLKEQAKRLNLKNIIFLGALADVDKNALLALCYAFVFPSHLRSEAFGLSLLEAAMFGKPMISCDIQTGTSYINKHDQTGLVVNPADPESLRSAMMFLWENQERAMEMGVAAKQHYLSEFTYSEMIRKYIEVYQAAK